MILPDRATFRRLWADHTVIPVWTTRLADLETPVAAFLKLVGPDDDGFLLESVEHAERWSRWSFVGTRSPGTITSAGPGETLAVVGDLGVDVPVDAGVLAALDALVSHHRTPDLGDVEAGGLPPLHSGVVGFMGYDVVREVEPLGDPPPDDVGHPMAAVAMIGSLAAFDHWRQQVHLIDNVIVDADSDPDAAWDAAAARVEAMAAQLGEPLAYPSAPPPQPSGDDPMAGVARSMTSDQYCRAVEVAREHILAGDAFQIVLAQRFDVALDADPFDVYRVLRQMNPSPYMYFLRQAATTVVGSSPEPMVQVLDGRVVSRPIAGTRPRGDTPTADANLAAELAEHPKERAEHVMLVDLARNDIGRVTSFGTHTVDELMSIERYSHVMHLTSQVSGELAPDTSTIDVLRATLPAGTVSGAPKVRAMQIIDELEPTRRGPYAGVVGYVDFSGNLDTAIAIRTMFVRDGRASVQAGAGIVADSDPAAEDAECANKARALLAAVGPARVMTASRRAGADL